MAIRLTDALVRKLDIPAKSNKITYDDAVKGFGIRVTAKGARAFILNYTVDGREGRVTIGDFPAWSVTDAREQARKMRREVDSGIDLALERNKQRAAPTVQEMWERYERDHLPRKATRTQADTKSMFTNYILPVMGLLKVAAITHSQIDDLHASISKSGKKIRANRVIEVIRKVFNLSIRWGWRTDNPASGIERNPELKRTRFLSDDEVDRIFKALPQQQEQDSADALAMLFFTGARKSEVLSATWTEIDFINQRWNKPSAHTKQRQEHSVPLSPQALELLTRRKRHNDHLSRPSPWVFEGVNGSHLLDVRRTWDSVCLAAQVTDARIHDIRHTYASILASGGVPLFHIGALLGHTQPQTTARYAHLVDSALREATQLVGRKIGGEKQLEAQPVS